VLKEMSSINFTRSYIKSGANIFLKSLSCTRRDLDTQKIYTYLLENNYSIVNDPSKADYIIIMTCGTTQELANISLKSIEKFKKFNAELIVAGCIPETHGEELKKIFKGKILSTKNLDNIDKFLPSVTKKFSELPDAHTRWDGQNNKTLKGIFRRIHAHIKFIRKIDWFLLNSLIKVVGKNIVHVAPFNRLIPQPGQYYISISRGCTYNCSYCVVKKGVGPLHSKPPEQCVNELLYGLQQGYHSFFLEADDSGPYGTDIGSNLPQLLKKMIDIDGNFTIKLSHTHPEWLIKYKSEFIEIFKKKKINNILAPIQSGSNRILQLMTRPYLIKEVVGALEAFKNTDSELSIGVDLIIGFPTETEEDFQDTLHLFDKIHFDYGILIPFSDFKGTKASTIKPKIPKQVVDKRMKTALRYLRKKNYVAWRIHNSSIIFYAR
jgi:tRNA A37 methylthiotransferase MiaB